MGGVCANCGVPLEANAAFCIVCGAPVERPAAQGYVGPMDSEPHMCMQCGAVLDSDALYCVSCGARVDSNGAMPGGMFGGAVPGAAPRRECPVCGWALEPDAIYCISCGSPVEQGPSNIGAMDGYGTDNGRFDGTMRVEQSNTNGTGGYDATVIDRGGMWPQDSGLAPSGEIPAPTGMPPASSGGSSGPIMLVPAPESSEDDDDVTARPRLIMLTREEARSGCRKKVRVNRDTTIEVVVPAGVDVNTKLDAPGYGHFDEMTGQRGPLRLTFYVD